MFLVSDLLSSPLSSTFLSRLFLGHNVSNCVHDGLWLTYCVSIWLSLSDAYRVCIYLGHTFS